MTTSRLWDDRYMNLAKHVAEWSKDRNTKVGCVVIGPDREVRSIGYNGFPRGINDDIEHRHARPDKYTWTEHAERNAIYNAARVGVPLKGCIMYLPWFPCVDCARAIIQCGLQELVAIEPDTTHSQWGEQFASALVLLQESDTSLRWYSSSSEGQ